MGRPLAERLAADVLRPVPGEVCLELPSGGGVLSAVLARAVGANGRVVVADPLCEALTPSAASAADAGGSPSGGVAPTSASGGRAAVEVTELPVDQGWADVAGSLLTLPHRDAPHALLQAAAAALRPAGRLGVAVWGGRVDDALPLVAVAEALRAAAIGVGAIDVALRGCDLGTLAVDAGLPAAEVIRLREVVRFDGVGQMLGVVCAMYGLDAELQGVDDAILALVGATLERRVGAMARPDGTLVLPVGLSVLRWIAPPGGG